MTALNVPAGVDELTFAAMFLPPVIVVINRQPWSRQAKSAAAVGVCLVFGVAMSWLRGDLDFSNWRPMLLQAGVGAVVLHRMFRDPAAPTAPTAN